LSSLAKRILTLLILGFTLATHLFRLFFY